MAKPNLKPMKVPPSFQEAMRKLKERERIPMRVRLDDFGKQIEEQLREKRNFQPRLPSIKLRKIISKKGSAVDVIYVFISIFVLGLSFLVITKVWDGVDDKARNLFNSSAPERMAVDKVDAVVGALDNYFLIILMLGGTAIIVLASMVRADPVFYWIFFFIFLVGLIMAAVFSNAYERVAATPALDSTNFEVQNYVMSNFPIIFLVFAVILLIVIYGKTRAGR